MDFERVMKMRHLVLIRTLGAELSIRRCAELLHTSQSAVSRAVADIESQLGQKLFTRTTRSIVPTQFGLSMIWHAQRILGDLGQAEADFLALARGARQVVHVGVLSGISPAFLGRAVAAFAERRPDVELSLHDGLAPSLFRDLTQDRVNMILSHIDVPRSEGGVLVEQLYAESVAVMAGSHHPLARRRRRLTLADLTEQRWVLPPVGTTVRIAMERELLLRAKNKLLPIVECASPHHMGAVLQHSRLLAAMPRSVGRWLEQDCKVAAVLKVEDLRLDWPFCVARSAGSTPSSAEEALLECLREVSVEP